MPCQAHSGSLITLCGSWSCISIKQHKVQMYQKAQGFAESSSRTVWLRTQTSSPGSRASQRPADSTQPHILPSTQQQPWWDREHQKAADQATAAISLYFPLSTPHPLSGLLKSQSFNSGRVVRAFIIPVTLLSMKHCPKP